MRAESRRRWRAWLALVVLVALVGGVVLGAIAAGRRTDSAFPSFLAAHGFDAAVYTTKPWPRDVKLADVTSVTELLGPDTGQPSCACTHPINPTDFGIIFEPPTGRRLFKLVSGRLPDPSAPDQVLASFALQQDDGVHLGSVIRVPFYSARQTAAYNNATGAPPQPDGPVVAFRVVGFEATEYEFPSGTTPSYDLYTTPAFAHGLLSRTAFGYVYAVRLRHGAADLARFDSEVSALGAEASNEDTVIASVQASVHPQAIGWWILAALAAIVGLAVLGQALVRQSIVESEDYPTMAALGADRRQLLALGLARNLVVGLAGAAGALVVATALSPVAPLGEARVAESYTGVSFDALVLLLGALVIVALVFVLGIWPALRAARALPSDDRAEVPRASLIVGRLVALGAPPSAVIGVRNAFERKGGKASVPVGSALLGTILAVIALCGTVVFGASLAHLTATPRLYGDTFQLNFTDPNGTGPDATLLASLEHNRAISAITEGYAVEVSINKVPVGAVAGSPIRGGLLLSSVDGPVPDADGQIGLGVTTMHQLGVHLGSVVEVTVASPSGGENTVPFRVVSRISFPVLGGVVGLGRGAAMTVAGYKAAVCPAGPGRQTCLRALQSGPASGGLLASVVAGRQGQAAVNYYLRAYQSITALPITPTSLVNFGEAVNFPLIFGGMLALSGAATLVHLLVVSVTRRRREIGLLKALGFVNRQIVASVAWQATALVGVGTVVGVPLGIVLGREVWSAFANNLGVVPVPVVEPWLLVAVVVGIFVVANLLAVAPALAARRSKPQQLLRAQ
ncbi:MAG: FtsX-like permease family protein [Acidimicrobiales bacterium]